MVLTAGLLRSFNLLLISDRCFLALVLPFTPLLNMQSSISNTSMESLFSICMKILFSSYLFLSLLHSKMKNTNRLSFLRAGGKTAPETYIEAYELPRKEVEIWKQKIFQSWKTLIAFQAISKTLDCISLWSPFLSMKRLPNSPAVGFTIKIKIYVLWTAGDFLIL